jgi:hypothetical protein
VILGKLELILASLPGVLAAILRYFAALHLKMLRNVSLYLNLYFLYHPLPRPNPRPNSNHSIYRIRFMQQLFHPHKSIGHKSFSVSKGLLTIPFLTTHHLSTMSAAEYLQYTAQSKLQVSHYEVLL